MAETTEVTVTKTWAKLSDGDCTVQSVISDKWHVDVRLRADDTRLKQYQVFPDNPVHQFS